MTQPNRASFTDFVDTFDVARYRAAPDDWVVAVSDVVNSTVAITNGRYKDVNMAGAAAIASILNACGRDDLPFAFGGDGAVVLVPPELREISAKALAATRRMCKEVIGLDLRGALIPISEIKKRGREILIASHDLGSGRMLAMLSGGGIEVAERLCKSPEGAVFAVEASQEDPDLTGLSCRWEPLKSGRGVILSVLVRARDETSLLPAVYRDIYSRIAAIVGTDSPAQTARLSVRWPPGALATETQMKGRAGRFKRLCRILLEGVVQHLSQFTGKALFGFDARAYNESLPRHSDYRKYSDALRMVIDCTPAEAEAVRRLLNEAWRNGAIDYGTHMAGAALMTCFVRNLEEGRHVHFIDGADGGYALAASDMKQRMAATR